MGHKFTPEELRILNQMGFTMGEIEGGKKESKAPKEEWEIEEQDLEKARIKRKILKQLEDLLRLIHRPEFGTWGFVFVEMQKILGGTRWEKYCNMVQNCRTRESLERFVHNAWLGIAGLSEARLEIKTRGQLGFEKDQNIRLKH